MTIAAFDVNSSVGAVVAVAVIAIFGWYLTTIRDPQRKLPRPSSTLPILGNLLEIIVHKFDFYEWMLSVTEEVRGKPWRLDIPGGIKFIIFSNPEATEHVLKNEFASFEKGQLTYEVMQELLGGGIFNVDGDTWYRQRKIGSRIFTHNNMKNAMYNQVAGHTKTFCSILDKAAKGPQGTTLDLAAMLSNYTMDTFVEMAFGYEMHCLTREISHEFQAAFDRAAQNVNLRFMSPKFFWQFMRMFNLGAEKQYVKDIAILNETVIKILTQNIQHRQEKTVEFAATNLIDLFLNSENDTEDGGAQNKDIDIEYLRDMVMNFIIAGRDTTAQALSWLFLNLHQNPHVVAKIREELRAEVPALMNNEIDVISIDDVGKLEYLDAVLKENLRLHPSVPFNAKQCVIESVFPDGTKIVPGEWVSFSTYLQGRMEHVWGKDAKKFIPERFLEIDPATGRKVTFSQYKFVSFHGGPRLCLGMNLAMLEMKIAVSSILSKFDIVVNNPHLVTYARSITLPVKNPMNVLIKPVATV